MESAHTSFDLQFGRALVSAKPILYARACKFCNNANAAEDYVQETLLRAWRDRDRFEPGSYFMTWLTSILYLQIITDYRRVARRRKILKQRYFYSATGYDDAEQVVIFHQAVELLDTLPVALRDAVVAVRFEGQTADEAGERFGVSGKTVAWRIYQAQAAILASWGESAYKRTSTVTLSKRRKIEAIELKAA